MNLLHPIQNLTFRKKFTIIATMICISQIRRIFLGIGLLYFFSVSLIPWFHFHPEKDHDHVDGQVYHSHSLPSPKSEHKHDSHKHEGHAPQTIFQLFSDIAPGLQNSSNGLTNFIHKLEANKYHITADHISSAAFLFQNRVFDASRIRSPISLFPQEYYVHFVTNLSPPIS